MILNYIGESWVPAQEKKVFLKICPFKGDILEEVSACEAMDFVRALQFAKKSLLLPKRPDFEERGQILRKIADIITENEMAYSKREASHQAVPESFVLENSVRPAARAFISAAEDTEFKLQHPNHDSFLPTGIVVIAPHWGLSLRFLCEKLAPAIGAGNAVIVKPCSDSPVTGQILGEILERIRSEFPEAQWASGTCQILQGQKEDLLELMAGHPSVRAIAASSSLLTGELIQKAASPTWKKMQLHMGYNNSGLVLPDAKPEECIEQIYNSAFIGQGQISCNISRLFVLESQVVQWTDLLLEQSKKSKWQGPMMRKTDRPRLEDLLRQVRADQGKIIAGGEISDQGGLYLSPTMTQDLSHCSVLQQDTIAAPLLIISAVKYAHEMVKWVNTGYYGQIAQVWGSLEKTSAIAQKLEVGEVWVNGWVEKSRRIPYGVKQSFFGVADDRTFGTFFSDCKKIV